MIGHSCASSALSAVRFFFPVSLFSVSCNSSARPHGSPRKVSAAHDLWRTRRMQASAHLESLVPFSIFKEEKVERRGLAEYLYVYSFLLCFSRLFSASPSVQPLPHLCLRRVLCILAMWKVNISTEFSDKASAHEIL